MCDDSAIADCKRSTGPRPPGSGPAPADALAYSPTMRLTTEQLSALRAALQRSFGAGARLWVFGSRVDDQARGGDYDFLVQTDDADAARLVDAKLDVVLYVPALDPQPRPIHRLALSQGVELT